MAEFLTSPAFIGFVSGGTGIFVGAIINYFLGLKHYHKTTIFNARLEIYPKFSIIRKDLIGEEGFELSNDYEKYLSQIALIGSEKTSAYAYYLLSFFKKTDKTISEENFDIFNNIVYILKESMRLDLCRTKTINSTISKKQLLEMDNDFKEKYLEQIK